MVLVKDRKQTEPMEGETIDRIFVRDCIKHEKKSRIRRNTTTMWVQVVSMCLVWITIMIIIPKRESLSIMVSAYMGHTLSFRIVGNGKKRNLYSTATTTTLPTLMTMEGTVDPRHVERQLQIFGRKGQIENVQSLYYSLFDKQQQPKLGVQVRPSTKLMNVAIAACSSSVSTSLDIFHHGNHHHICPNVYTYGALLKSCAISRNVTMALNLLHDMEVRTFYSYIYMAWFLYHFCLSQQLI